MGDKDPINAKKEQMIPQQNYLSEDLILEEILTRLPVKSVVRFKSVSKQWYSTLSSSDFANAHLMKSSLSHPSAPVNTLFIKSGENFYIFSYDDDDEEVSGNFEDNLVKLDADFGVEESLSVVGCCNGLICLTPSSDKYFIIWNPATRKLHKYLTRFSIELCVFENIGFGYVSSVDDYKYFRILLGCVRNGMHNILYIYSLKENKWREIVFDVDDDDDDDFDMLPCRGALLINEKLYWPAYSGGDDIIIASFDLGVERFDRVKVNLVETDLLGVMGGCLSKCNYDTLMGDKLLHILEPPAVLKSIGLPEGLRLDKNSKMIGFTRSGKVFVTGPSIDEPSDVPPSTTLGIVDTLTKPVQYTMLLRFDKLLSIDRYVPSLVSPFAIGEPSEA